ncbi:MAG: hypothetical protein LUE88_01235 [Clostridiales bacterium]|nr:hypothetical protein [Clostridiales bacterium]
MRRKIMSLLVAVVMCAAMLPVTAMAMQVYISVETSGETSAIDAEPADTIEDVKGKIFDTFGYAADQQQLYYEEQLLEDSQTLADCGIQEEATLRLILNSYAVSLADGLSGADTATYGTDYTGSIDSFSTSYDYTVSYTVGGGEAQNAAVDSETGEFTISGEAITGELEVTLAASEPTSSAAEEEADEPSEEEANAEGEEEAEESGQPAALTAVPVLTAVNGTYGAFTVQSGDGECSYDNGLLTISGGGEYTITQTDGTENATSDTIKVTSSDAVTLTLAGVNISSSSAPPVELTGAGTVTVKLLNKNTLDASGSNRYAGLQLTSENLTITSADGDGAITGSLDATGGNYAAGIGGGNETDMSGSITINGGTVTALSIGGGGFVGGGGRASGA